MADRLVVKSRDTLRLVGSSSNTRIVAGSVVKLVSGGPMGEQGPQGDAAVGSYRHTQPFGQPLIVWLVVHNLGFDPGGIVVFEEKSPGVFVQTDGQLNYIDDNMFTIQFDAAIAGYVVVS